MVHSTDIKKKKSMIKLDYNFMLDTSIGKHGISQKDVQKDTAKMLAAHKTVLDNRGKGWQEWTELVNAPVAELQKIKADLKPVFEKAESFVVLGIGGSALGPLSVFSALLHYRHNELPRAKRKAPKFYVEDNIDPERMQALLDVIDLKTAYFNVITKSGETSETLAQFLILYDILKKQLGAAEAKKRIIVTTTIGKGTLYKIAEKEGFKIYGVGEGVGGRFSVFSSVGLIPFAALGIDIEKLIAGAKKMAESSYIADPTKNAALMSAYLQVKSMSKGKNISVMMPYADSLKFMADFYGQLWGESLAKAVDNKGKTVFSGQTPAKSLGVTDQHSQIQLYTEGPFDKVLTFITVNKFNKSMPIPSDDSIEACCFLKGQSLEKLLTAELIATRFAVTKAGRPNFTIELDSVTEESVGALLMYFMYQTAFAGALMNIDTYNQPGVEEGKKATFAMLGRKGYEEKLAEVNAKKTSNEFVISVR